MDLQRGNLRFVILASGLQPGQRLIDFVQARVQDREKVWKPKHPKLQLLKEQVAEAQRAVKLQVAIKLFTQARR